MPSALAAVSPICLLPVVLGPGLSAPTFDGTTTKVRGAYFYASQGPEHFAVLAQHNFNLGCVKLGLDPADAPVDHAALSQVAGLAQGAAQAGIAFMPVLNWAGALEVAFMQQGTRCFVTADGTRLTQTPCPNDPRQWKHVWELRALAIGDRGLPEGLKGVLLDPEMYGADIGGYPDSGCYCDQCWAEYLVTIRSSAPPDLPPPERAPWLQAHGEDALYLAHQELVLMSLVAASRDAIHAEHPDLLLGFLNFQDIFFYRALARGMGTAERPALILSETTYASGYSEGAVDGTVQHLAAIGAQAIFCPGLSLGRWHPDDLAAHAYHCAAHSGGYWVFTTYSLTTPPDKLSGDYRIPAPAEDYWRALALANAELQRLERDPAHITSLTLGPRKAVFVPVNASGLTPPALRPVASSPPMGFKQTRQTLLRRQAVVYLLSPAGGPTRLRLACVPLGSYSDGASWIVLGPGGERLAEGAVEPNQTGELILNLPAGKPCALAVNAGANRFSVDSEGCYETLPTSPELAICGGGSTLYFFVPDSAERISVHLRTDSEAETVRCDIVSPGGEIVESAVGGFPRRHEMAVQVPPEHRGKLWRLDIGPAPTGVFEDVFLAFGPEVPPFVAEAPDRLMLPDGG